MARTLRRRPGAHDAQAILKALGPDALSLIEDQNLEAAAKLGDWVVEACTPLGALSCWDRLIGAALELETKGRTLEALAIRNAVDLVKKIQIYADILVQFKGRASPTEQTKRLAAQIIDCWGKILDLPKRDNRAAMSLIYCFAEGAADRWKAAGLPPYPLEAFKWGSVAVRGLEYFRLNFPEYAAHLSPDDIDEGINAWKHSGKRGPKAHPRETKWQVTARILRKAQASPASPASLKTMWARYQQRG